MKTVFGLHKTRILYALAVTKSSEILMRNLGFELVSEAADRVDRCNLYRFSFTRASWARLCHRVGDLRAMCDWHISADQASKKGFRVS
jgi:hypothetical protein